MNETTQNLLTLEPTKSIVILKDFNDVLAVLVAVGIMLIMGMSTEFSQIVDHFKKPIDISIGMFSQFFFMPLLGFCLIKTSDFSGASRLGIILVSCSPSGTVSNIFTYFLEGDINLSLSMTSLAIILGLGFTPFNFWLYGHWLDLGSLQIPYTAMMQSIAIIWVPAGISMIFKRKFPKIAAFIVKYLSSFPIVLLILNLVLYNVIYPDLILNFQWQLGIIALIMPLCGAMFGYGLSYIFKRSNSVAIAVAVESGVQNISIAFTIIVMSKFSFSEQKQLLIFPTLYSISMNCTALLVCFCCRIYKCVKTNQSSFDLKEKQVEQKSEKCNSSFEKNTSG